jgi:dolichol-phosphate mannosyltransferase
LSGSSTLEERPASAVARRADEIAERAGADLVRRHGRDPGCPAVAVVIPCYRVGAQVLDVLAGIGPEAQAIYVVDDACPDGSGERVRTLCGDRRVRVLAHEVNAGVGGAMLTGMQRAIEEGAEIIVKLDGDGQMDPRLLPLFIDPIRTGEADYAKGNRFFFPDSLRAMPPARLIGNAGLSFLAKLSSGYWQVFDPNNGYVAIHADVAACLPFAKIDRRYFFESDLLFRLNILQARVIEVPMRAVYGDEPSSLNAAKAVLPFFFKHLRNFAKRILYNYFLRNFSIASVQLVAGILLLAFGLGFGLWNWRVEGAPATAGTVVLAALSIMLGFQLLLAFINHDVQSAPTTALHRRLAFHRAIAAHAQREEPPP